MDEQTKNNFWYADWSFPIFVGLLSSGVFAGTHMYYLYGIGAFNEVAFVSMLRAGMDTGVYGAVAAFGASFLFARIIEGSLVGILDIGGAIQTGGVWVCQHYCWGPDLYSRLLISLPLWLLA
ncbi:putative inner membrane protein [Yersinia enterocolitica]|nr:putative inner membrane protein [Yersinia enterocolitica]